MGRRMAESLSFPRSGAGCCLVIVQSAQSYPNGPRDQLGRRPGGPLARLPCFRDAGAIPGELLAVGGGQHVASGTSAGKGIVGHSLRHRTLGVFAERAAVTAIEDQELPLDLSAMKRIVIDPRAQTARVQPGVTTAELEHASFRWGLAPLVDRHGFVLANLIAAHVVLPDGELVAADDELLREIRIGRALGIVVDATYRLHPAADLRR